MENIFIRRRGKSVLHVRVFPIRPRVNAAARYMRDKGKPLHFIATSLGIPRPRLDNLVGAHALFDFSRVKRP